MVNEETMKKMVLGDALMNYCINELGFIFNDELGHFFTKDNEPLHWDNFMVFDIPTFTDENGYGYSHLMFWGDGTIEFQIDGDGDSYNWCDFSIETLTNIINNLNNEK